jgi:modulator of FtsH protease HflK
MKTDSHTPKSSAIASIVQALRSQIARLFPQISLQSDGPWGNGGAGSDDEDGGKNGDDGGKKGGKKPAADNPWAMPQPDRRTGSRTRKPSALDQILGAGKTRMGGGGPALPTLPNGRPVWPVLALGFVAIWLFWSSIWRIDAQEAGVVTSFGKYSHTLGEGLNFTLPYPLQSVDKVQISQQRLQIGSTDASAQDMVLTKDQNLLDLTYVVRWNVRSPSQFLFQMANEGDKIDNTIKDVGETAMRATVANFNYDDATGTQREEIGRQVRQRMQAILDRYKSGIQIQGIDIRQTDPPSQVKEAFTRVTSAQQQSATLRNQAETFARQVTEEAQGQAQAFDVVYEQYRLAPEVTKRRMYYETMERVLGQIDKTIIEANGVTPYLPLSEVRRRAAEAEEPAVTVTAPKAGASANKE